MGSQRTLQDTNTMLGLRQMRLSTSSRINRAEDDTVGYGIAKKLQAMVCGPALHVNVVPIRCGRS